MKVQVRMTGGERNFTCDYWKIEDGFFMFWKESSNKPMLRTHAIRVELVQEIREVE